MHYDSYNYDKNSLAVVVMGEHGIGALLYAVGGYLRREIDEAGLRHLSDLGLDGVDPGVWVWEGKYVWTPGGFEYPLDGDSEPVGEFRKPTPEEWAAIVDGRCPWNDDDWKLSEGDLEELRCESFTLGKLKVF